MLSFFSHLVWGHLYCSFFPATINGIALNIFLAGIIHGAPECVGVVVGLAAAGVRWPSEPV